MISLTESKQIPLSISVADTPEIKFKAKEIFHLSQLPRAVVVVWALENHSKLTQTTLSLTNNRTREAKKNRAICFLSSRCLSLQYSSYDSRMSRPIGSFNSLFVVGVSTTPKPPHWALCYIENSSIVHDSYFMYNFFSSSSLIASVFQASTHYKTLRNFIQ